MHLEHGAPLITGGGGLWLIGLALCAVVQLSFLNRTLANSPVTYGVPTYQTLLTLLTIVIGGIFFDEVCTACARAAVRSRSHAAVVSAQSHTEPYAPLPAPPAPTAGLRYERVRGWACEEAGACRVVSVRGEGAPRPRAR